MKGILGWGIPFARESPLALITLVAENGQLHNMESTSSNEMFGTCSVLLREEMAFPKLWFIGGCRVFGHRTVHARNSLLEEGKKPGLLVGWKFGSKLYGSKCMDKILRLDLLQSPSRRCKDLPNGTWHQHWPL